MFWKCAVVITKLTKLQTPCPPCFFQPILPQWLCFEDDYKRNYLSFPFLNELAQITLILTVAHILVSYF